MNIGQAWEKLNLGHQAVMLNHTHRKLAQNRQDLSQYRESMMGKALPKSQPQGDEDGMFVLGDFNQTVEQAPARSGGSWFKTLAGIGLAAAGIGTPAALALPAILDALNPPPVVAPADPPVVDFSDTDTKYDLELAD